MATVSGVLFFTITHRLDLNDCSHTLHNEKGHHPLPDDGPGPTLRHAWLHHPPCLAGMVVPVLQDVCVSRVARLSAQSLSNMTIPLAKG
jgi:hypothetical protein